MAVEQRWDVGVYARGGERERGKRGRREPRGFVDMFSRGLSTPPPSPPMSSPRPLGLFVQPACLQHRYIRHANASHIFERPERLRAVLLGVAAAVARLELAAHNPPPQDDLSRLLSSLSLVAPAQPTAHLHLVHSPPLPPTPGSILLHHPAVQLAHSPVPEAPFPYIGPGSAGPSGVSFPSSDYLRDLVKWASEAADRIKQTGCEIPEGLGLNPGDLYLGPGSIIAIEGAVSFFFLFTVSATQWPDAKLDPDSLPSGRSRSPENKIGTCEGGAVNTPYGGSCRCIVHESVLCHKTTGSPLWRRCTLWVSTLFVCGSARISLATRFCYVNNVVIGALHGIHWI